MNLIIKAGLAALVVGTSSAAVFAGAGHQNSCENECTGKIPVELNVPKICSLDDVTGKITLDKAGKGTGSFRVGANDAYKLLVTSTNGSKLLNSANQAIPINIVTKAPNGSAVNLGTPFSSASTIGTANGHKYTVDVNTTQAFGINTAAGTYRDTYNIKVDF